MLKPNQLLYLIFSILLLSCKNENSTYAIIDFRKTLQPYLIKIVSEGIVFYNDSLNIIASDKELLQLTQSEHPILRASSFREILERKSFNHFDILMNHLDDTARVRIDAGEFGIWTRTVSDDILEEAKWETQDAKNKTIDKILTKHNYLRSAYLILHYIEPQEKYYSFIKDMATRPRRLSIYDGYELDFNDIEYALYGLAKFKKKEDIQIIKEQFMKHVWELSDISFQLMKEFPDTAYFDALQEYHRRKFYDFNGNRRGGFTGFVTDRADPEDFIRALVMQQSNKSAMLLDTILTRLPLMKYMPDKENIRDKVVMEIWEHPCPAYARLRIKIKNKAEENLKGIVTMSVNSEGEYINPIDTTHRLIRWLE